MKKLVIALALLGGMTAVAFATLSKSPTNEKKIEKKVEKKKHSCRHTCPFS